MPDSTVSVLIALGALGVVVFLLILALLRRRRSVAPPSPPPEPATFAFLERVGGGEGPRIYALNRPLAIVGRSEESDVHIKSDLPGAQTISRRHAQIRREDNDFIVEDLGSQNGIKVNGLVTHRNLLRDGYHVSFGSVEFVFHHSEPGEVVRSDS